MKQLHRKTLYQFIGFIIVSLVIISGTRLIGFPSASQLRSWSANLGIWFPCLFFLIHALVTIFPIPRTAFTLAAGLLFEPWLGISIAVLASTISSLLVLYTMNYAGWQLDRWTHHHRAAQFSRLIQHRGWSIVIGLRLIPAIPFSVINYSAGVTKIPAYSYGLATCIGLLPGTTAIVFLGDALAGKPHYLLILISIITSVIGLGILFFEIRTYRKNATLQP